MYLHYWRNENCIGSLTKCSPNPCCPNWIRGKITFFIFTLLFAASKGWNLSEASQGSVKIKIMSFFISINYFRKLWTGGLIKFFLLGFSYLKCGNKHFRHNSACIIQKWLRLKRIIIVRLSHISLTFPNGSKII